MKKLLAILLTMILCFTCSATTIFADEGTYNTIPAHATRHTIAITLQPEEEYSGDVSCNSDNTGISPYIWGDPSITMVDNHVAYTSSFYVSDRYFAFEMEGFLEGDPVTNEGYCVALQHTASQGIVASGSGYADGSLYKLDWITIPADGNYRFKITNDTDYILTVYITYYSWN